MAALRHLVLLIFVVFAALFEPGVASAKTAGSSVMSETRAAAEHCSEFGLRWGPGEVADSLLAAKDGGAPEETVSIFRAPRKGQGHYELEHGYSAKNHPRDDFNDGNAYFAGPADEGLAREYARHGPYEDGIIEVQIPRSQYDATFKPLERPYQGGPQVELPIPQEMFDLLNTFTRLFHN